MDKPKITIHSGIDGLALAKKAELAARVEEILTEEGEEFYNKAHGKDGRFTSGGSGGSSKEPKAISGEWGSKKGTTSDWGRGQSVTVPDHGVQRGFRGVSMRPSFLPSAPPPTRSYTEPSRPLMTRNEQPRSGYPKTTKRQQKWLDKQTQRRTRGF